MLHGRILIADDHAIVRIGLAMLIRQLRPQVSTREADSLESAIVLLKKYRFELVVFDINMPDGNSLDVFARMRAIQPDLKILVLAEFQTASYEKKLIKQGANGYLSKKVRNEEIQQAIRSILQGKSYYGSNHKQLTGSGKTPESIMELLSYREMEVSRLLLKGNSVLEIARTLNLQSNTISTYKKRIFEKLNVTNFADFVLLLNSYSS